MKYFALLFLVSYSTFGQKVDYNSIILPKTAKDIDYREKLVQLAWENSPQTELLNHELNISGLRVKDARRSWLENVRLTGNLNEFNLESIRGETNPQSAFYPKYNVSASISLGMLFTNPVKSKIEREGVGIALQNINAQKLALREEVLSKYEAYLAYKEIRDIRVEMLTQARTEYNLKEQGFRRGEISLQEYHTALDRHNLQKISMVEAERDLATAALALEALIGMKLSDVQ